jgi:hypothetical protein
VPQDLESLKQNLTKEAAILHAKRKIATQITPFSSYLNGIYISNSETKGKRVKLVLELLFAHTSIFSTFHFALEWACVTGTREIADIIIECYPDLVEQGEAVWDAKRNGITDKFKQLGLGQKFPALDVKAARDLPGFTFDPAHVLPSEVNIVKKVFFSFLFFFLPSLTQLKYAHFCVCGMVTHIEGLCMC